MKCPIEKFELIEHKEADTAFHYCDECRCMFLAKEQLMACIRRGKGVTESQGKPTVSYDVTQMVIERCCPACQSTTMLNKILNDVAIDICPECKAVWLGTDALKKVVERHREKKAAGKPDTTDAKKDSWDADEAGRAAAAFFEESGEWLDEIGSSAAEFFTIDF